MTWLRPIDIWFAQRVLPYENLFVRQARRWSKNAEEATDLVQEAYLKLLECEDWRGIRDPRAYVLKTIRNLVLQRIRRSQVVAIEDIPTPEFFETRDEAPGAFDIVAGREALAHLLADVEQLPPACRRVIQMRKIEELGPKEIARRLGISLSTVETHLARGMHQLMKMRRNVTPAHRSDEADRLDQQEKNEKRIFPLR